MPLNTQPTFNDLVNLTLDGFIKNKITDNIFKDNALLDKLKAKGKIKYDSSGGLTFTEFLLNNPNDTIQFQSLTGVINTNPQQHTERAFFLSKALVGSVSFTKEEELQNTADASLGDLIQTRITTAMSSFMDVIGTSLYGDGTANNGQAFGGLQLLIADDPTVGTVGGVNRATNSWWRNQVKAIGANPTAQQLVSGMSSLMIACQVQSGKRPDLIMSDSNYFELFLSQVQSIQQITQTGTGEIGYQILKFLNTDLALDPKCPTNRMYFINTDHINFKHRNQGFITTEKEQRPVNQFAYITPMYLYGNLTIDSARVHGVLKP